MHFYRRLVWGRLALETRVRSTLDDVDNRIRRTAFTLRAIETPGHSPDHVSFFEPSQRWLFQRRCVSSVDVKGLAPDVDLFAVRWESAYPGQPATWSDMFPGCGNVRRTPLPELHDKIVPLQFDAQSPGRKRRADGYEWPASSWKARPASSGCVSGRWATSRPQPG